MRIALITLLILTQPTLASEAHNSPWTTITRSTPKNTPVTHIQTPSLRSDKATHLTIACTKDKLSISIKWGYIPAGATVKAITISSKGTPATHQWRIAKGNQFIIPKINAPQFLHLLTRAAKLTTTVTAPNYQQKATFNIENLQTTLNASKHCRNKQSRIITKKNGRSNKLKEVIKRNLTIAGKILEPPAKTDAQLLQELINKGFWHKVTQPSNLPHAYTGIHFNQTNITTKETLCLFTLLQYSKINPKANILIIRDGRTGKRIGSYSSLGLDLD